MKALPSVLVDSFWGSARSVVARRFGPTIVIQQGPRNTPPAPKPPEPIQNTIILQQGRDGYSGCQDTTICSPRPNFNYGGWDQLRLRHSNKATPNAFDRALIRFELPDLPGLISIDDALLTLTVTHIDETLILDTIPFEACILTRDWGEGIHTGQAATQGEASHNAAHYLEDDWATPGAQNVPDDRLNPFFSWDAPTCPGITILDFLAPVRSWYQDALPNYGVILQPGGFNRFNVYYASRNHASQQSRPELGITYTYQPGA